MNWFLKLFKKNVKINNTISEEKKKFTPSDFTIESRFMNNEQYFFIQYQNKYLLKFQRSYQKENDTHYNYETYYSVHTIIDCIKECEYKNCTFRFSKKEDCYQIIKEYDNIMKEKDRLEKIQKQNEYIMSVDTSNFETKIISRKIPASDKYESFGQMYKNHIDSNIENKTENRTKKDDNFLTSMAVGAATNSTIIGSILGGDILGAAVGDLLNND